ncbi:MAG: glucose-1-phosphate cytidylyltransferase [Parcubacteria group bacterium]|jgi:glucose-1-phosphate cytidylyltransferase|nr:glucose-1-phosphate cytidylyltransferase [Parcubacteria group bacterium]MDP6265489.1 sugar phosphate nucleotidyltransferase [Candidatus Woesearchaeota archaeon]|tara:strand:- start:3031 stop:3732 length:702 start_codon:yes stop_codon:yes gene_type:complete
MQVVVLCGGKGTRLSELTKEIPKPLIEIGNKPILFHIMNAYSNHGYKDFILCLGYKGTMIRDYFNKNKNKDWNITFLNTGLETNKADRLKQTENFIKEENFFLTYGDDLSNVDIKNLSEYHKKNKKIVTLTAVQLQSPFGILDLNDSNEVIDFKEKPQLEYYMNGGYFVMNKKIFSYLKQGYDLEKEALKELAKENQIIAFLHKGFWKSMNTLKDVIELNEMWKSNQLKNILK